MGTSTTKRVVGRVPRGLMRGEMPGSTVLVEVVEMGFMTILVWVVICQALVLVVHLTAMNHPMVRGALRFLRVHALVVMGVSLRDLIFRIVGLSAILRDHGLGVVVVIVGFGMSFLFVVTPPLSRWLDTGFTLLDLTPVSEHLLTLMIVD